MALFKQLSLICTENDVPVVMFITYQFISNGLIESAKKYGWVETDLIVWIKNEAISNRKGNKFHHNNELIMVFRKNLLHSNYFNVVGKKIFNGHDVIHYGKKPTLLKQVADGKAINRYQKPVPLLMEIVKSLCPPDRTVLDLCSGSCSLALACATAGYNSVSIDTDEIQMLNVVADLKYHIQEIPEHVVTHAVCKLVFWCFFLFGKVPKKLKYFDFSFGLYLLKKF